MRGNTGSITVTPLVTTTYIIVPTNRFLANNDGFGDGNRVTATITVIVSGGAALTSTLRHTIMPVW